MLFIMKGQTDEEKKVRSLGPAPFPFIFYICLSCVRQILLVGSGVLKHIPAPNGKLLETVLNSCLVMCSPCLVKYEIC